MSFMCDYCLKGVQYGETGRHGRGVAGNRWKNRAQKTRKVFKPNLHTARIEVEGKILKVKLCTKCLRRLKVVKMPVAVA